jgi:UDP-arabinose 4-epimerase
LNNAVLVTGGAGYVGSHTCKALAKAGYRPIVYDNLVTGHRPAVKWGPLETGDVLDGARLAEVCERYDPVAAVHFAAYSFVGESVQDPQKYYRNNVAGSLSLFEVLRARKLPVLFSSTCATYGIPARVPISEDTPQQPINPYGTTKLVVERMLIDFDQAYAMRSAALRYFNAAGADRDGEIGEDHNPETHLIPLALRAVGNRDAALMVFGQDYETADGTAIRDYVHVEDLAVAHVAALRRLLSGAPSVQLNIGTGSGSSVLEVIRAVEKAAGQKVHWNGASRRAGDPPVLVADPARLKALLDVDPRGFAPLDDIVRTAWRWHSRQTATT